MKSKRLLELGRKKKNLPGGKELIKLSLSQLAAMLTNLLAIGPRVILRSAIQLLRANIWTRLISALVLIIFDIYSFAVKNISFKQLIINLILAVSLVFGGTIGWVLGTDAALIIVAENTVIWIIAGIVGAGFAGSLSEALCRKIVGRFLKSDIDDMLDFISDEFERLANEHNLSGERINELAKSIEIDDKICINCFSKSDKSKYAREVLLPYFDGF